MERLIINWRDETSEELPAEFFDTYKVSGDYLLAFAEGEIVYLANLEDVRSIIAL